MENMIVYKSKILDEKLKKLAVAKVGTIIAPVGYGKTTAGHMAVDDFPIAQQHWFTADKSGDNFDNGLYDWFLAELETIDLDCANQLKKLGYFNRVNRYDIKALLKNIIVDAPHYVIIDNLQYIKNEFTDILISALATGECANLHLILLSQFLTEKQKEILDKSDCIALTAQDLLLTKADIKEFALGLGVELADTDTALILQKTDGWIVFVALYLQKAKEITSAASGKLNNGEPQSGATASGEVKNNIAHSNATKNSEPQSGATASGEVKKNIAHSNATENNEQGGATANEPSGATANELQSGATANEPQVGAIEGAPKSNEPQVGAVLGAINTTVDIDTLLEDICWKKIDSAERHFLLYFSIWQTMTNSCFLHISKRDSLAIDEEKARALMSKMPLIKFEYISNGFTMHNLFRDFILLKFNDTLLDEKKFIYLIAGEFEKERGNRRRAVALFYKAHSLENLLSCDMSGLLMDKIDGVEFKEIALDIYHNCDDETLKKYPISALRLCYALYGMAQFAEFEDFILRLHKIVVDIGDQNLLGEWTLVSAFQVFPSVTKMTAVYEKASKLLTHPSKIFTCAEPYLFGCTSMWYLFYTKVGQMEKTADAIDKMIAIYNKLTNGHAGGAEMLYRGEAYCVEGRFDEAEILVRTAARLAEVKRNVSVVYGSALILGIICVYKDDMIGLEEAIKYLENRAMGYEFMQDTALNKYMTETVRGYLLALLMETQDSSSWTREWTCSGTELTFTNFMVKTTQITDLILHKEYKRAIANIEATLKLDKRLISLPTENFMRVGLALCYLAIGNLKMSAENLEISLSLAEKDKNYTFLACFRKYLAAMMMLPSVKDKHRVAIEEIKTLNLNYAIVRKKAIFDFVLTENSALAELTDRELQVAKLAALGKRNKEIAKELFLSEYTVKNHLAIIYQKLNIDRRSRLIEMLK